MGGRVYEVELTVPAGTVAAAPVIQTVTAWPDGQLAELDLLVPSGHAGLTGFQLINADTAIVPYQAGWIVADDYHKTWELGEYAPAGQLQVQGYNTDIYPHTFYARLLWQQAAQPAPVTADLAVSAPADDTISGLAVPDLGGPGSSSNPISPLGIGESLGLAAPAGQASQPAASAMTAAAANAPASQPVPIRRAGK